MIFRSNKVVNTVLTLTIGSLMTGCLFGDEESSDGVVSHTPIELVNYDSKASIFQKQPEQIEYTIQGQRINFLNSGVGCNDGEYNQYSSKSNIKFEISENTLNTIEGDRCFKLSGESNQLEGVEWNTDQIAYARDGECGEFYSVTEFSKNHPSDLSTPTYYFENGIMTRTEKKSVCKTRPFHGFRSQIIRDMEVQDCQNMKFIDMNTDREIGIEYVSGSVDNRAGKTIVHFGVNQCIHEWGSDVDLSRESCTQSINLIMNENLYPGSSLNYLVDQSTIKGEVDFADCLKENGVTNKELRYYLHGVFK